MNTHSGVVKNVQNGDSNQSITVKKRQKKRVRVLIIDDSSIVRRVLFNNLKEDPEIFVSGTAGDAYEAMDKINRLKPEVLTLDLNMPRMHGITFLKQLMKKNPIPVIILSSYTQKGGETVVEAMQAGAIDVMAKPESPQHIAAMLKELKIKIKTAGGLHLTKEQIVHSQNYIPMMKETRRTRIFAIGASTGGVEALTTVLTALPKNSPGTVVVQHMPEHFTAAFATRLDRLCSMEILEAKDGDKVVPGRVLVAPGGKHMELRKHGSVYSVTLTNGAKVHHQRPSVDVLFESVAKYAGNVAIGAILTGMGGDGAEGMLSMYEAGARTIAQDKKTCVVYGMPKEAAALGGAELIAPLDKIASHMVQFAEQPI